MKIRLSSYFLLLGFTAAGILLLDNPNFGVAYLVSFSPLVLFTVQARKRMQNESIPVFVAIYALYAFYFIRPLFLGFYPEWFGFPHLGQPSEHLYITSILYVGAASAFFLFGLYGALVLCGVKKNYLLTHSSIGAISRLGFLFLMMLLVLVLIWGGLVLVLDVGVKKVYSSSEVLKYILPINLILPATIGYLLVRRISFLEKFIVITIVLAMFSLALVAGSKLGVFLMLLYILLLFLLVFGDKELKAIYVFMLMIACIVLVFGSITVANVIKYHGISALFNSDDWYMGYSEYLLFTVDRITFRLNGYDGLLATFTEHPASLEEVLNWGNILSQALTKLIPFYNTESMSVGKAVGVYYGNKGVDVKFAGSLGLFGTLNYMYGALGGIGAAALIGVFYGACYRCLLTLSVGVVENAILTLVLSYLMLHCLSSGNFDSLIQEFVITSVHIFFYYNVLRFIVYLATTSPKKSRVLDS